MDGFEKLLEKERKSVERFVRFRINSRSDANDVLQEVYFTTYQKFPQLKNREAFKAWIISIARNKCNDYFRRKAILLEIPLDGLKDFQLSDSRYGAAEIYSVRDAIERLGDRDKQILYLYFWKDMPQAEIANKLNIPLGTVKSRLYAAKQNFKNSYSSHTNISRGELKMKKLPQILPEYKIEKSENPPFDVKCEELMGWFLVPKLGEKLTWGMYDIPSRKCSYVYDMKVIGRARVHGIEGVELTAREASCSDKNDVTDHTFIAQLTDTHCRYLATVRKEGDLKDYLTFLDGDEFLLNWGFGEDNCGSETNLSQKGEIRRDGNDVTSAKDKEFLLDIVGRYTVTINGKNYDTVCVMEVEKYNCGVVTERYLDRKGRTVLWRRFNRDDWAIELYKKTWCEQLPTNERLTVNGITYVHWYDCITDYIL